jgi:hypothetical protein
MYEIPTHRWHHAEKKQHLIHLKHDQRDETCILSLVDATKGLARRSQVQTHTSGLGKSYADVTAASEGHRCEFRILLCSSDPSVNRHQALHCNISCDRTDLEDDDSLLLQRQNLFFAFVVKGYLPRAESTS